ncbi:hypothetical protein BDP81DRAFT_474310 [Colletotrichum phormii]|uniref:Rhodopsin domain-containing protein n=1 Tax=Colletotrichum phormii TaxID=359342 RepID=A0AAI9ZIQ6_9PEZI|nr:uncharacterized protein BDP81DRAFT_474310 [Colletotrichum phormii]KAK1625343.1 hypothetical protein BDP81DRAFT_474310 [Colletotrichum phormii]
MSDKEGAAPPPEGVVPDFQHPQDVLHTINLVSQILSIVSVSIFMMLRIYAKTLIAPPFYLDDWMAVVPWILSIGYSSTGLVMHRYEGGFHLYEISKDNFVGFLKGLYADTLVYGPNSYFTKLALLPIVIRVFRLNKKTIIGTYAVIVFMTGYYVPVLFLKTFIRHPIAGYWDSTLNATCLNQRAIFVADTAISAITDTAVLCLPIPVALSLRMSWTKRLKVIVGTARLIRSNGQVSWAGWRLPWAKWDNRLSHHGRLRWGNHPGRLHLLRSAPAHNVNRKNNNSNYHGHRRDCCRRYTLMRKCITPVIPTVILMLSAGGVATAASIVRMILVIQLQKSDDEPVDFIRFNLLGTAEVSIGMICACLPAINILFMRGFSGSAEASRNTGQSSKKYFELKFLMGSKLQTQNLTAVNTTGTTGPVLGFHISYRKNEPSNLGRTRRRGKRHLVG